MQYKDAASSGYGYMSITSNNNKKKILVGGISLKSNVPNLYYTVNNQSQ